MSRPAVFLDRDGVINRSVVREGKPYPPASVQELEILPGVKQALEALKKAGFLLVVVTNQPDVARGTTLKDSVDRIHNHLKSELPLDAILTCFHDDADKCDCRKPKPGLMFQAAKEMSIDLSASFMVGDRWRDIEAGQKAGCQNFFVDYGYDEKQPQSYDFRVSSLLEASQIILQKDKS